MTDFVRVKLENGAEATLGREFAEAKGIDILDKPAADVRGVALADKPPYKLDPVAGGGATKAELQAEADLRGLSVEGTGSGGNVTKDDLAAAIQAHDASNAV